MSRTGMPPEPAPTWNIWAIDHPLPEEGQRREDRGKRNDLRLRVGWYLPSVLCPPSSVLCSLGFRQRPLAGLVPDLVAGQPAPGGLGGEDAGELRRVPAAGGPRRALPPQAEGLALQQVRA